MEDFKKIWWNKWGREIRLNFKRKDWGDNEEKKENRKE